MKLYIAGPDVFYPNAAELAEHAHAECKKRGFTALCPVDNAVSPAPPAQMSKAIYEQNIAMIQKADAVVANISPFRGPSADAGTVWEIGYAYGLGKPVVAFTTDKSDYKSRVKEDGMMIEDFGGVDNLMITHALKSIHSTIEEALDSLSQSHE